MVGGNGHKDEAESKVKFCPFLDKYCIAERCAVHTEVVKAFGGVQQKMGLCGFNALGMILSEINAKTAPPQPQRINLPRIIKG